MELIIIGAAIGCLVMWAISVRHRLMIMEENISTAMDRIGVQLSLRFDAVAALLEIAGGYAVNESRIIGDKVKSGKSDVTGSSAPSDVIKQEALISEALSFVHSVTERHPEIKTGKKYLSAMKAADSYEKTVRTGRLIYNDSVTRLNRELHIFPISLIGGMLGIGKREYLEDVSIITGR